MQEDRHHIAAALDLDLGHAGAVQGLFQVFTDLLVLHDQVADLLVTGIPAGIPVFDDAHAQAVGIDFLSHKRFSSLLCLFRHSQGDVRSALVDTVGAALGPGHHPLEDGAGSGVHLGHHQLGGVHAEVVLGVGNGALQKLLQGLGGSLGGLHQDGHGAARVLAADQVADDLDLPGGDADVAQIGLRNFIFHVLHPPSTQSFRCPRKVRVGANSPSLCPTMSSWT